MFEIKRVESTIDFKKCKNCGKLKATYRFHKKGNGLDTWCARCKNEANLKYRHKTKEYKENKRKADFEKYGVDIFKVMDWVRHHYRLKWGSLSEVAKEYMVKEYKKFN